MLDVDLHGTDRHTLAPVRAAQLDRTRRVVTLDSADLQDASAMPSLRRDAAPTDDEGRQFHDRYQKAYGERGWDANRDFHVSRGDHDLEFRRRDAELAAATEEDAARRERERQDREHAEQRRQEAERRLEAQRAEQQRHQQQGGAQREVRWAQGQEEIVVERRPVIEEVIIRRRVVDPGSLQGGAQAGAAGSAGMGSGAADRATNSGFADRVADKADDVKDRFDGNPASRPGPDSTDRRI